MLVKKPQREQKNHPTYIYICVHGWMYLNPKATNFSFFGGCENFNSPERYAFDQQLIFRTKIYRERKKINYWLKHENVTSLWTFAEMSHTNTICASFSPSFRFAHTLNTKCWIIFGFACKLFALYLVVCCFSFACLLVYVRPHQCGRDLFTLKSSAFRFFRRVKCYCCFGFIHTGLVNECVRLSTYVRCIHL